MFIQEAFFDSQKLLSSFFENQKNIEQIQKSINLMTQTLKNGGRILSCGNGGSSCDSMHFAEELTGRYRKDRKPLSAMSLTDPAHMTCVANDFGYEFVFSRLVEAWGRTGDVLLAISTSGNSKNVIEAIKSAKKSNIKTIGLLGKDGGSIKDLVDVPIIVDHKVTDRIQEIHIKIIHILIEGIERQIFPEHY